jgi:hypothetical protein
MAIEKEYYQYLNQVWSECLIAANNNKDTSVVFFDKAASPYHYWKEANLFTEQKKQGPMVTVTLTDGEAKTIDHKDQIKKEAFRWNKDNYCWQRTLLEKDWETLGKTEPFNKLHADIKKES